MIIDNFITIVPGSDSKFTLYLNYLLIGVTFWGIVFMAIISELPGAISDNIQRIKAVNHWENHIATLQPFLSQTKNSVTFLFFVGFS